MSARLLVLLLVAMSLATLEAGETHVFVLSGQSNMAGLDPKLSFTPTVTKGLSGHQVIVVKNARGGQPIRRWYKEWKPAEGEGPKADGALYDALLADVRKAVGEKQVDSYTFVWMQGERDAKEKHGTVYEKSLEGLIEQLKTDLEVERLNVVVGRLSDCLETPHWELVRKAQVAVGEKNDHRAWVDTDDLNGPKDGLHYTKEGYAELGKRFAEKALDLIAAD